MRYRANVFCLFCRNPSLILLLPFLILVLELLFLPTSTVAAQVGISVDDRVTVSFSGLRLNRRTRTFDAVAEVTNTSTTLIPGPLSLVITDLSPATVSLANAQGTTPSGAPYVEIASPRGFLAPGETVRNIKLQFTNPTRRRFNFNWQVLGSPVVSTPGSVPDALSVGSVTTVNFVVTVAGFGPEPLTVSLERLDGPGISYPMRDDGAVGDRQKDDGTYLAVVELDASEKEAQECFSFEARVESVGGQLRSPTYDLCVTDFPVTVSPSDLGEFVIDRDSGELAVANEVVVSFVPGTTEAAIEGTVQDLNSVIAGLDGEVAGTILGLGLYQVRFAFRLTEPELALVLSTLRGMSQVAFAEANILVFGSALPNDQSFTDLGIFIPGSQEALSAINAPAAWDLAKGDGVTIAIVDSGVDLNHPDLAAKVTASHDYIDEDENPDDPDGHGTRVAGIAAAMTDNASGIAGVGWDSQILAVRVLLPKDLSGKAIAVGGGLAIVAGIKRAADEGARVINASFAAPGFETPICAAVDYARNVDDETDEARRAIVVAAAGNDATDREYFPAACDGAIAVANATLDGTLHSTSNHGGWIDVWAPGTDILSTVPTALTTCPPNGTGCYDFATGTSFAAPMVSGAAALMLSLDATPTQVEELLEHVDTAPPVDQIIDVGTLVASFGPPPVAVPDVVGQAQAAAQTTLVNTGLVASITTQSSTTVPIEQVISQSPAATTNVSGGATVNLVISSGPPGISLTILNSFTVENSQTIGLAADSSTVYLTFGGSGGRSEMDLYNPSGVFLGSVTLQGNPPNAFPGFTDVAIRNDSELYFVSQVDNSRDGAIYRFTKAGNFLGHELFSPTINNPLGVAFDGTDVYINQNDSPSFLYRVNPATGNVLQTFTANPNHGQRLGLAFWATRNLLFESYDQGVSVVDPATGLEIKHFPSGGPELGYDGQSVDVAVSGDTLYVVANTPNKTVLRYSIQFNP